MTLAQPRRRPCGLGSVSYDDPSVRTLERPPRRERCPSPGMTLRQEPPWRTTFRTYWSLGWHPAPCLISPSQMSSSEAKVRLHPGKSKVPVINAQAWDSPDNGQQRPGDLKSREQSQTTSEDMQEGILERGKTTYEPTHSEGLVSLSDYREGLRLRHSDPE